MTNNHGALFSWRGCLLSLLALALGSVSESVGQRERRGAVASAPAASRHSRRIPDTVDQLTDTVWPLDTSEDIQTGYHFRLDAVRSGAVPNRAIFREGSPYGLEWQNKVAFCAIMKDETAQNVVEWLEYHRWLGVDKVFLREHGPALTMQSELGHFIDSGFLEYRTLPGEGMPRLLVQTEWYNECSSLRTQEGMSWIGFFDIDEFVIILNKQQAVTEKGALKPLLRKQFRYNAAITLQWVLFGSAGQWEHPAEGQLKGFNTCNGVLGFQLKCMASTYWLQPQLPFLDTRVHECTLRAGAAAVTTDGRPHPLFWILNPKLHRQAVLYRGIMNYKVSEQRRRTISDDHSMVIFHYVVRSQKQFLRHKIRDNLNGTGIYARSFAELASKNSWTTDRELLAGFQGFEAQHALDGNHAICKLGSALHAAYTADIRAGTATQQVHSQMTDF